MSRALPTAAPPDDEHDRADPAHWFREGARPADAPIWWQLQQQAELVEALRTLCSGHVGWVQLRLWVFLELMALPQARVSRDALNRHFHLLREDALDLALRPLRGAGLLEWDAGTLEYSLTPRATALMALLSPLARPADEDAELAGLLAQVAGAHQLGTLQPTQLRHLQAQLARLHDEFADAIASGSEFRLRRARSRHDRVFELIERASQVLAAIAASAQDDPAALRLAREIGLAQARLLAMKSQFDRALHQAERQRVTLGSTGVTTSDVRTWLRSVRDPAALLGDALAQPLRPAFLLGHDLLDVAEAEWERDRPSAAPEALPDAAEAPPGELRALALPPELQALVQALNAWGQADAPVRDLVDALRGSSDDPRYAAVAYRAQLMPLLGDPQAQALKGATGDLARQPWQVLWTNHVQALSLPEVAAASAGWLHRPGAQPPAPQPLPIPPETESPPR